MFQTAYVSSEASYLLTLDQTKFSVQRRNLLLQWVSLYRGLAISQERIAYKEHMKSFHGILASMVSESRRWLLMLDQDMSRCLIGKEFAVT